MINMSRTSHYPLHRASLAIARDSRSLSWLLQASCVVAASLFVALCAHVSVSLPFTPVPFTLQPFAVILVGMLLGPSAGFAAMALYLAEGAAGLPVFTPAGLPGLARLVGPTAGYLFAYPVAAAIAGAVPTWLASRRFVAYALTGTAAMAVIYLSGAAWFSIVTHLPFAATLAGSVLPFAATDAAKILIASGMASALSHRS